MSTTRLECEPLKALNDALCREEESNDFYKRAAQRTEHTKGKEMFISLAEQAKTQADLLERQIIALTQHNDWAVPECALTCEFDPNTEILPRDQASLERAIKTNTTDLDAILFALKAENSNYERYASLAKVNASEQARHFYTYLAEQTSKRLQTLMMNYERANQGWL